MVTVPEAATQHLLLAKSYLRMGDVVVMRDIHVLDYPMTLVAVRITGVVQLKITVERVANLYLETVTLRAHRKHRIS